MSLGTALSFPSLNKTKQKKYTKNLDRNQEHESSQYLSLEWGGLRTHGEGEEIPLVPRKSDIGNHENCIFFSRLTCLKKQWVKYL